MIERDGNVQTCSKNLAHAETGDDSDDAFELFMSGGGMLFPFRQGYAAMGELLRKFHPEAWRHDEAVLGGLVLYLLKHGQAARAKSYLTATNLKFEKTYQFDVLDLLLALHLGEPVSDEKLNGWRRLERELPVIDPLMLGLYYNSIMAMFVRLGRASDARVAGQQAISCFREDGNSYLEHFIYIHLADLDLVEGRLRSARRGLMTAERCLAQSGVCYGNEQALIGVSRLAIDYEFGRFEKVRDEAPGLCVSLMTGDSWSELFVQLARIAILSTYFLEGLGPAKLALESLQADYARRHGGVAASIDVLAALLHHLDWRPNEAEQIFGAIDLAMIQSTLGDVLSSEVSVALGMHADIRLLTPRGAIVSTLQKARTLKGKERRKAIEKALTLAIAEGQIAPFLEQRDVFLGTSAKLSQSAFRRGRRELSRMTACVLRRVSDSYVVPPPLRDLGFSRRQYRVAAALQSGATNKQVARYLGTSEATVKYHLTSLYRMTKTKRRSEFIDFIHKIELLTDY